MKTKRFLSIALTLVMLISLIQIPAFAADSEPVISDAKVVYDMTKAYEESSNVIEYPDNYHTTFNSDEIAITWCDNVGCRLHFLLDETDYITAADRQVRWHFEFKADSDETHNSEVRFVASGNTTSSDYESATKTRYVGLWIDESGNIQCGNGGVWEGTTGSTRTLADDTWYSFDIIYDLTEQTMKYYIEGAYYGASMTGEGPAAITTFSLDSKKSLDRNSFRYLRNVQVIKGEGAAIDENKLVVNGSAVTEEVTLTLGAPVASMTASNIEVKSAATGLAASNVAVTNIDNFTKKVSFTPNANGGLHIVTIKDTGVADCITYVDYPSVAEGQYDFLTSALKGEQTITDEGERLTYFGSTDVALDAEVPAALSGEGTAVLTLNIEIPKGSAEREHRVFLYAKGKEPGTTDTPWTANGVSNGVAAMWGMENAYSTTLAKVETRTMGMTSAGDAITTNLEQPDDNIFEVKTVLNIKPTGLGGDLYINDQLISSKTVFDSNWLQTPGNITWLYLHQAKGTNLKIKSAEGIYSYATEKPAVAAVNYVMADGTRAVLNAGSNVDPATIKKLEVKFTEEVNEETLSAITLGDVDLGTPVSLGSNTWEISIAGNLAADTAYTLNVPATVTTLAKGSAITAYAGSINTGAGSTSFSNLTASSTKAEVTITNYGNTGSAVLMYAVYGSTGVLEVCDFKTINYTPADVTITPYIDVTGYSAGKTVRAFLFNSLSNIKPIVTPAAVYPEQ